ASAPVKTALVLTALYAERRTRITAPGPTPDQSERLPAPMCAPLTTRRGEVIIEPAGWAGELARDPISVPWGPASSACLTAAAPHGTSVFADAGELRVKESDRIATTVSMLRACGVEAEAVGDGLVVHGAPGAPLRAARVHAEGDHRIAMAASVLALCADGPS